MVRVCFDDSSVGWKHQINNGIVHTNHTPRKVHQERMMMPTIEELQLCPKIGDDVAKVGRLYSFSMIDDSKDIPNANIALLHTNESNM